MNNNLVAGLVIVGAVLLSSFVFKPEVNVTVNPEQPLGGIIREVGDCVDVNGVTTCSYSKAMSTASTTCSIKPPTATSTLVFFSAHVATSTGAASLYEIGKATTAYATTTLLGSASLSTSGKGTIVASSTVDGLDGKTMFTGNQYLNVKSSSPTLITGTCMAEFILN